MLEPPARLIARVRGHGFACLVNAWGMSLALLINVVQLLSIVVVPVSRRFVYDVNCALTGWWMKLTVLWARRFLGARVEVSGDPLPKGENAIVIANHQQMADITYLMHLALDAGQLHHLKWFIKDGLKYVPGIGWALLFIDALFVKRSWAKDKASIERTFRKLSASNAPFWLMLFAEGTRLTPVKLAKAAYLAAERGDRPLRYVLSPRPMGFTASVTGLRGRAVAVYDLTLAYPRGVPSLWQYMAGFSGTAHVHVRRFPMDELPEGRDELAAFLRRLFEEKDDLLHAFYSEGRFTAVQIRKAS